MPRTGADCGAQAITHQGGHIRIKNRSKAGLESRDSFLDFLRRHGAARQVLRLKEAPRPATRTHRAHELQAAAKAPVGIGAGQQGVVLFHGRLTGGEAGGKQVTNHGRKGRVIKARLQSSPLHIRQRIAAFMQAELQELIQLTD